MEKELDLFRNKLAALEEQAKREVTMSVNRLSAGCSGPEGQRHQQMKRQEFLNKGRAYAAKLGLTMPEPQIVFREEEGVNGRYDTKEGVYVVIPSKLDM